MGPNATTASRRFLGEESSQSRWGDWEGRALINDLLREREMLVLERGVCGGYKQPWAKAAGGVGGSGRDD